MKTNNISLIKFYLSTLILLTGLGATQANAAVELITPSILDTFDAGDNLEVRVAPVSRNSTITNVALFFDGNFVRNERVAPYSWGVGAQPERRGVFSSLSAGEHTLRIVTTEQNGDRSTINFDFEVEGDTPPVNALSSEELDRDVIRFLSQSTFGATEVAYNQMRAQINANGSNRLDVYEDWIDNQLALPPTNMLDLMDGILSTGAISFIRSEERDHTFWTLAVNSPDQLRHRLAQTLSEILVISDDVVELHLAFRGMSDYWDMLASSGTGTYKDLLADVTRHTTMGTYLSSIQNVPADPEAGSFPDENFAREIMQLFSMGLVHLNQDGSVVLDGNNQPIPTYDNEVISEMARVFTGLSHSQLTINGGNNTNFFTNINNQSGDQIRWVAPMQFFPFRHDFGEKQLFTDQETGTQLVLPARNSSQGQADQELDAVISALVSHSATAPRISRMLIQQLVTSNPSPAYVERVANAFGEEGDLRATIKAILLDPEARDPDSVNDKTFGKQKSPIFHATSFLRLTGVNSQFYLDGRNNDLTFRNANRFPRNAAYLRIDPFDTQEHRSLSAASVFNFYSKEFAPSAEFIDESLVSPESEILLESSQVDTINDIFQIIENGTLFPNQAGNFSITPAQQRVFLNRDRAQEIWDETPGNPYQKASALVDHLDFFFNASQLRLSSDVSRSRTAIINAVRNSSGDDRISLALYGVANAPESMIQK